MPQLNPLPPPFGSEPFTVASALRAGIGPQRLRNSQLHRPAHGVRLPAELPRDLAVQCRALALVLPDDAVFSHLTALRLLGVEVPWRLEEDKSLHVSVGNGAVVPQRKNVTSHTRSYERPTILGDGFFYFPAEVVWTQLAASLQVPDLVVLGDCMMRRKSPSTTLEKLERAVESLRPRTRGIRRLHSALGLVHAGTDSSMETRARLILVEAGFPCPVVNQQVYDGAGAFICRPDLSFPELKIAIEYDGDIHRTDPQVWRRDVAKRQLLEAAGWRVLTVTADDVLRHPTRMTTWLRNAIRTSP